MMGIGEGPLQQRGPTSTFLSQVYRGERSASEAVAGFMGLNNPNEGMFGGALGIQDERHATGLLKNAWKPGAIARRLPGQLKLASRGTALSALFVPLDIGMRVHTGESMGAATVRATGGAIGGAVGAIIGGGIGGALFPGVGNFVGGVIGGIVGYGIGESIANKQVAFYGHLEGLGRRARRTELGGRISAANMTRAAYSMRARALQQINRSGMNARAMLGQESTLMHMR